MAQLIQSNKNIAKWTNQLIKIPSKRGPWLSIQTFTRFKGTTSLVQAKVEQMTTQRCTLRMSRDTKLNHTLLQWSHRQRKMARRRTHHNHRSGSLSQRSMEATCPWIVSYLHSHMELLQQLEENATLTRDHPSALETGPQVSDALATLILRERAGNSTRIKHRSFQKLQRIRSMTRLNQLFLAFRKTFQKTDSLALLKNIFHHARLMNLIWQMQSKFNFLSTNFNFLETSTIKVSLFTIRSLFWRALPLSEFFQVLELIITRLNQWFSIVKLEWSRLVLKRRKVRSKQTKRSRRRKTLGQLSRTSLTLRKRRRMSLKTIQTTNQQNPLNSLLQKLRAHQPQKVKKWKNLSSPFSKSASKNWRKIKWKIWL